MDTEVAANDQVPSTRCLANNRAARSCPTANAARPAGLARRRTDVGMRRLWCTPHHASADVAGTSARYGPGQQRRCRRHQHWAIDYGLLLERLALQRVVQRQVGRVHTIDEGARRRA
jgi:hypothetical protein